VRIELLFASSEKNLSPLFNALGAAYPNPSNSSVVIPIFVKDRVPIQISIYDVMGRRVRNLTDYSSTPGYHQVTWDARDEQGERVGKGLYIYRMSIAPTRSGRVIIE
jgi:hypothetical protein